MSAHDDLTVAAQAADNEYLQVLDDLDAEQAQHAADNQANLARISVLTSQVNDLQAALDECQGGTPPEPPPTGTRLLLGSAISVSPGHEGVLWDVGRTYRDSKATESIQVYKTKIILYTDPTRTRTPAAVKTDLTRIVNLAKTNNIANFEIHYGFDNEADREHTTDAEIAQYKADFKAMAPAVRSVPGGSLWMNLTRWGTTSGGGYVCDKFVTADMLPYIDGLAINCYADNLEKDPIVYSTNWVWLDNMFKWVAGKGVKKVSGWETGHRADPAQPNGRPTWAKNMAVEYEKRAKAAGLTPVALAWWDQVTTSTRDTRFEHDHPKTRDAWKAASLL